MTEKLPDWAVEMAIELVDSDQFKGLMAVDRVGKCSEMVAKALVAAERRGIERAAKVAEGEPYHERYRTWPWWRLDTDGTRGNLGNEDDIVRHSDDIAAAIRQIGGEG